MDCLSDSLLIESYEKALELNLASDFIEVLHKELRKRQINVCQQY